MRAIYLQRIDSRVNSAGVRAVMMDKPRRRFNWRKAAENLLKLAGLVSFGVVVYMMFCQMAGR